ncbi:MAG: bifunctional 2-polyprenyl-6-hydroxyphenol methylase/3-demethylubiquinol 3-O-methyltransferase UbiG [Alphaproteobacteria bacterium]|nr:bifunctional 2-polyprenyl-6-hydroxyphenol methylase/3-demethylubiquinol 3-O-methyltransferase UbiG [Alphaproteobacteria bacterium]
MTALASSHRHPEGAPNGSVDPAEIAKFSAMADAWWDPTGKFKPLHKLNPTRLAYIVERVTSHFGRDPRANRSLDGLRILDIGCGGGLISEPMARLGAKVTGIDASERNIAVASLHAARSGLQIEYRAATAEALAEAGEQFDLVLNLEVVEHVADVDSYMAACCTLVRPGGMTVVATLNRTVRSLLLAKIGAEYVLRWLPRGTHDWRRFLRPSELAATIRPHGLLVREIAGLSYDPFGDRFSIGRDAAVNYMMMAVRP